MMELLQPLIMTFCIGLFLVFVYAYHLHDKDIPPCKTIYKLETDEIEYAKVFTEFKNRPNIPTHSDPDFHNPTVDYIQNIYRV